MTIKATSELLSSAEMVVAKFLHGRPLGFLDSYFTVMKNTPNI